MGVKDWLRKLVPFHRRNLLDEREREQAIQDAIEMCLKAREKAGDPPNPAETDAVFDDLLDAFDKAGLDPVRVWRAADTAFPDNPRWLEALAARALADKATDRDTLQILHRQSERDPENLPLLLRLTECYEATGDEYMLAHVSAQCLKLAKTLRERNPQSLPRGINRDLCDALVEDLSQKLARMYLAMNREDDEAMELYVKAIDQDATQVDYLGVVARKFMADGRTDPKAVEVYETALAFDMDNRPLQRFLGRLYLTAGRSLEGLGILRRLVATAPDDAQARDTLIGFLVDHRDLWEGGDIALLLAHLKANPGAMPALKSLTDHFMATEDLGDQAAEVYRLAAGRGIARSRCLRLLARRQVDRKEWKLVIENLEQVAQSEGGYSPDLIVPLATAYSALDRTDEAALTIYQAAVRAGSRSERIHEALCHHLFIERKTDPAAIQQFRQTLEIFPDCKWAARGVVHEHLRIKNYSLAFEEALVLLKKEPGDREMLGLLARALAHEPNPRFLAQIQELGEAPVREILRLAYHEKPSAKRLALALAKSELKAGSREARLIPILRTALQTEPDDPALSSALSETLWRAGREAEAVEVDTQILAAAPSARMSEKFSGETVKDDRVVAARQAAVRLSGYHARAGSSSPQALEGLWKSIEMGVCADEAVVFLARHIAATGGHARRDLDVLRRAIDLQPTDSVLRLAYLKTKASRGDVEEPLRWCLDQLRQSPGRKIVRDLLRDVIGSCRKEDLKTDILGQLRGMCSANRDDRDLAQIAARAHQIANVMNPQVRAIFEKAIGGQADDPSLLLNLARSYYDAADYSKAADMYAALLDKNPNNEEAVLQLARLYCRLHRHTPDALALVVRARALKPGDPDLDLFQAELYLEDGKANEGAEVLEALLAAAPHRNTEVLAVAERNRATLEESPRGLLLLARLYIQAQEPDDALHMLDTLQSVGEVPENELLAIYDALVENYPENLRARMERAVLHKVAGRYERALADFEALVAEEGATQGILAELAEVLQLHLKQSPEPDLESLRKLARLHQQAGEVEESAQVYRQIVERAPGDYEARRALARTAVELDRLDEALEHLRKCPAHLEVAVCLSDVGRAYERKGQWSKAIETLRMAAETGHATSEDQVRLSRLEQRQRQEKAAQSARAVIQELPARAQERYELLQQISIGEDSTYRAYDRNLDEVVALKVFPAEFPSDPGEADLFLKRADALKEFSHPQVVRIFDIGRDLPRRYLAMEYLTGGDLAAKIRRVRGPLSIPEVRRLGTDLAEALGAAHAADLIHGALAPGKILYNIDGKIKITGFVPGPASPWIRHWDGGEKAEFAAFRSPQVRAGGAPNAADDMYAFGALLFHVVSGKTPELEKTAPDTWRPGELAPAIRRAGPMLSTMILRCLSPAAEERPASFGELGRLIGSV